MFYLVAAIVAVSVLADQVLKWIVCNTLEIGQSVPLINGVFHFTYIRNFGAAFSILQNRLVFLILITVVITVVLLAFLARTRKTANLLMRISIPLIIGGGIGLWTWPDWVPLVGGDIFFEPVFNFADCCVTIGAALLVLGLLTWDEGKSRKGDSHG